MNESEAYIFLLKDAIFSNLIFSPHTELALYVMKMMGSYKQIYILLFSSLGAFIAIICNYIFGVFGYKIYKFSKDAKMNIRHAKLEEFYIKYGEYFLFLTFVPNIGKFIPFIAGFTRYNINKYMLYAFLGEFAYYLFIIFLI